MIGCELSLKTRFHQPARQTRPRHGRTSPANFAFQQQLLTEASELEETASALSL